jgi:hypothetical protein
MSSGEYVQVRRRRRMEWGGSETPHTVLVRGDDRQGVPRRSTRPIVIQTPVDPMAFAMGRRSGPSRHRHQQNPSSIKAGPYIPMPGSPDPTLMFAPNPWAARCQTPPEHGRIRMLTDPESVASPHLRTWWWRDRTLTEWMDDIEQATTDVSENSMSRIVFGSDYPQKITELFHANQRRRWLAHKVLQRLRVRIWSRRPACNMDLIDMTPVTDKEAISITDTTNRRVFRFHRRDLLNTVMSNLTMSDEFMPTPRHPTNPWTNEPFTRAQTMTVCHRLAADFVARGRCPPPLLSAFWASNFNIKRFLRENSAVLSQHAIQNHFRDINDDNFHTVFDTITGLLSDAGCDYSPMAVRRWLQAAPATPTHKEWLALCRDYTLYLNLHIQTRVAWFDYAHIYRDVRILFARTPLPDMTSTRLRIIRGQTEPTVPTAATTPNTVITPTLPTQLPGDIAGVQGLLGLLLQPPPMPEPISADFIDGSGNTISIELALQLIQSSLFRL